MRARLRVWVAEAQARHTGWGECSEPIDRFIRLYDVDAVATQPAVRVT